ncbi:MAG TPA: hypothetical protein ENK55_08400, partial [Actinobacteria bacterium]|nr:hypothetical protein [Actinomycetota bacterium]
MGNLVVGGALFPTVLVPASDEPQILFTTSVAMAVWLAAGEELGPSAYDWVEGFWEPERGLFRGMGPPSDVESYFAVLVLTDLGDRPLERRYGEGIVEWASNLWVDPDTGEPFDLSDSDLDWIPDVAYGVWLLDLVRRTVEDPAVADRAGAILASRRDELEEVCRVVEDADASRVAVLVDVVLRAGGRCVLPEAARRRAAAWHLEERPGAGSMTLGIDALERGGYLPEGTTVETIELAEEAWFRMGPGVGQAWQAFDLAAEPAHRRGHRLELPGWMLEDLRREIGGEEVGASGLGPYAPTTVRALHALALAGGRRSADEWWQRVGWERLEPIDRLWLGLAIDPSRLTPGDVEAGPSDAATSPQDLRVVALARRATGLPCDAPGMEQLVDSLAAAGSPRDVAELRDLAEALVGVEA